MAEEIAKPDNSEGLSPQAPQGIDLSLLQKKINEQNTAAERLERATKRMNEISDVSKEQELFLYCRNCFNYFSRWHVTVPAEVVCRCGSSRTVLLSINNAKY